MDRLALTSRVRTITRDLSNSTFREQDIYDFINEGIDRCKQVVPQLAGMIYLQANEEIPKRLPVEYHHILSIYASSRLYSQDDRHYQGGTLMNEFETKLDQLLMAIQGGDVIIRDDAGLEVVIPYKEDYVVNNYFSSNTGTYDDPDEGVGGLPA